MRAWTNRRSSKLDIRDFVKKHLSYLVLTSSHLQKVLYKTILENWNILVRAIHLLLFI